MQEKLEQATTAIAILCGEYPRVTDTFIQREVAAMRAAGIKVKTISIRKPRENERGTEEQAAESRRTRYILPCGPLTLLSSHFRMALNSPYKYARSLKTAVTVRPPGICGLYYQLCYFAEAAVVADMCRQSNLKHIHNHAATASGFVAMLAAEMTDMTFSMTLHGFGILKEPSRWCLTEKLERGVFTICVSQYIRTQAMLWCDSKYWDRLHVVHCGVQVSDFHPRSHSGVGHSIYFAGRLDSVKGLPVLLKAMQQVAERTCPETTLHLIGDGPQRSELQQLAHRLGIQSAVQFHGYLSQQEIQRHLRQADVVVLSSFYEGIPVVLIEALACGVPVVAPQITGIPELVQDGVNGFLFISGDSDQLAEKIVELLRKGSIRQRFGRAGRRKVEREFNSATEVQRLCSRILQSVGETANPIPPNSSTTMSDPCAVRVKCAQTALQKRG